MAELRTILEFRMNIEFRITTTAYLGSLPYQHTHVFTTKRDIVLKGRTLRWDIGWFTVDGWGYSVLDVLLKLPPEAMI